MVEPAEIGERGLQRILAGMAERRVADVVREAQCLGQVLVQPQRARAIVRPICATSRLCVRRTR